MIAFPNAKINLGLQILRKRSDGYHDISSLFLPIPLCDVLEIVEAKEFSFHTSGLPIPGASQDNLCMKAYKLLQADFNLPPVAIQLHKVIPMGGGLGGGSSDAAFLLRLLNDLFSLELSDTSLETYAGKLGSDCPFFIKNQPAIASGTGLELRQSDFSLKGHYLLLLFPGTHIGTQEAYAGVKPAEPGSTIDTLISLPLASWKGRLVNDFETSVFKIHPRLRELKEQLYEMGAVYASMTGSGSTLYGVFENEPADGDLPEGTGSWKGKL